MEEKSRKAVRCHESVVLEHVLKSIPKKRKELEDLFTKEMTIVGTLVGVQANGMSY